MEKKNDMSRSGRCTMIVFDEFASVDNNDVIIMSDTYNSGFARRTVNIDLSIYIKGEKDE